MPRAWRVLSWAFEQTKTVQKKKKQIQFGSRSPRHKCHPLRELRLAFRLLDHISSYWCTGSNTLTLDVFSGVCTKTCTAITS